MENVYYDEWFFKKCSKHIAIFQEKERKTKNKRNLIFLKFKRKLQFILRQKPEICHDVVFKELILNQFKMLSVSSIRFSFVE